MKEKTGKSIALILVLVLLLTALAAVFIVRARKEAAERAAIEAEEARIAAMETFTGVLHADELGELESYPNLRTADLRGSDCYDEILRYMDAHPGVEVSYTVPLCGETVENHEKKLTIEPESADAAELEEKLRYLPALSELSLPRTGFTKEELAALGSAYPALDIRYSIELFGEELSGETSVLDLSAMEPAQVQEAAERLPMLPKLEEIRLLDAEGNAKLSLEDVGALQAATEARIDYAFSLFGKTVNINDERVEFVNEKLGSEAVTELRRVLPYMTGCRYLLLDNCGIDNELLAELREEFRSTKIVWRIFLNGYLNCLTDVKVIHLTFGLNNASAALIGYCEDLEYLDLGHNTLSDVSFVSKLSKLKLFILSYNYVSDLTPLAACKELEMLELYFCIYVKDFSPLTACPKLKLLNVSATGVHDISPAKDIPTLERFYCVMNTGITDEQKAELAQALPNCWITYSQPDYPHINIGWSYDEMGPSGGLKDKTRAQWYLDMAKIFLYNIEDWYFGDLPEDMRGQED